MKKQNLATPDAFQIMSASIHDAASVLKAMSSDTRLKILCALNKEELPVSQLAELTGQTSSAVSQHLTKLRSAGLVQSRRQAQMIYYSSTDGVGKDIVGTLCKFYEK